MYLPKERKEVVDKNISAVETVDDLLYAVTTFILKAWDDNPSNETLALITKELVVDPKNSRFVTTLRSELADRFTVADIYTACRMAYDEFNSRVVRVFRGLECKENGDLEGYKKIVTELLTELNTELKQKAVSGLIIPGNK